MKRIIKPVFALESPVITTNMFQTEVSISMFIRQTDHDAELSILDIEKY